jgi:tetratricopeptide (TPR) repeat protein
VLFGRDQERTQIGALLEAARASRSGALIIRGEPGIGKSALLEDAREHADDMTVLTARGVQSESELPFAALHQLFRPALDRVAALPAPQAEALEGALGLGSSTGRERFLVFAGCLSLLSELAEERPVLCLLDDAQWLDRASAEALLFVTRRLDAEGVAMLFAVRDGEPSAFDGADVACLQLDGLATEAAEKLLAHGTGVDAAPQVRDQLLAQTQGNALALLEIPSVLTRSQLAGAQPLPAELPLTGQLESVFLARVRRLAPEVQRLLLVAAADDSESAAAVIQASGPGDGAVAALDTAEEAGLISVQGQRLRFRHPLVRSAVYSAATSQERRAAHLALAADLSGDAEQLDRRAWHLAAAALEPDEEVASALDGAAERAQRRAAFDAAVRAFERAAELTPDSARRGRRLVQAARCASIAGADAHAVSLAERAGVAVDDPLARAELASVVGVAEIRRGRPGNAPGPLVSAAREIAALDPGQALELLLDAAWAAAEEGDPHVQREICEAAVRMTGSMLDERAQFILSLLKGLGALAASDIETAVDQLGRVIAAGAVSQHPRHVIWAGSAALGLGEEERAGALYARGASIARSQGALGVLVVALAVIGLHQFVAQRFDQAAVAAAEAEKLTRDVGAENLLPLTKFVLAAVAAIRGKDEETERHVSDALAISRVHGLRLGAARTILALALLDLGRGRWADALTRLESMPVTRMGLATGLAMRSIPDRVEAAVRAGRPEAAASALALFERWSATVNVPSVWPRIPHRERGEHAEHDQRGGGDNTPDLLAVHSSASRQPVQPVSGRSRGTR